MNNNTKPTNTKDAKPKFANLDMDKFKFDFRLFFPQNSEDNFSNTLEK